MKRYALVQAASSDLLEIWEHIAANSPSAAERFVERLLQTFHSIGENPRNGHGRQDLVDDRELQFFPVGNYLILYRVTSQMVVVLAIVHGNPDIPAFIERRGI